MKNTLVLLVLFLILGCGGGNQQTGFENDEPVSSAPIAKSKIITSDTLFIDALGANMSEMKFNKKVIRVPANKNITIALTNVVSHRSIKLCLVFFVPKLVFI